MWNRIRGGASMARGVFVVVCVLGLTLCQAQCNINKCLVYEMGLGCGCDTCEDGFYRFNSTLCSPCSSPCLTCSSSASTCTSCIDGRYLLGNACPTCLAPCTKCVDSATTCLACAVGYYQSGISCLPCVAPCSQCTSATQCTSCVQGYFRSKDKCYQCSCGPDRYITVNCPGTGTTNSPTCSGCSGCGSGNFISSPCTGTSTVLTTGDRVCSVCPPCAVGSYVATACTGNAKHLPDNSCQRCNDWPCPAGQRQSGSVCNGFGFTNSQTCTACANTIGQSPFYDCTTAGTFVSGFRCPGNTPVDTQTCPTCSIARCEACSGSVCTQCMPGHTLSASGTSCTVCGNGGASYACASGQYAAGVRCNGTASSDTQSCASCGAAIPGCLQCLSATQCITAAEGSYILNGNSVQVCGNGGAQGSYGCAEPGTTETGTACTGTGTGDTQICSRCIYPCGNCLATAGTCTSCAPGFFLSGSNCLPSQCGGHPDPPYGGSYPPCSVVENGDSCLLTCISGYTATGAGAVCSAGSYINVPTCNDVNECATGNNGCTGVCSNYPGGASCSVVNQCATSNGFCPQNTSCVVTAPGRFRCEDINECETNNGNCGPAFAWKCTNTYSYRICTDIGACLNYTCPSNTTCVNTATEPICVCAPGFELTGTVCSPVSDSGVSAGAVAGAVIGSLIGLGVAGGLIYFFCIRRRQQPSRHLKKLESATKSKMGADSTRDSSANNRPMPMLGGGESSEMATVSLSTSTQYPQNLSPVEERAFLASFPNRKTTSELDEYFAYLHHHRDKFKSLAVLSEYLHPLKFSPASHPKQFQRFTEGDNLQRWVFPFLFKNAAAGMTSMSMSMDGAMSGSTSTEQSLFEIAMVLIVDVHYEQFLNDAPLAGVTTIASMLNRSGAGNVIQVKSGLERTFNWLKQTSDWLWANEAITFTRLILFTYCSKVTNKYVFRDAPDSVPYANLFEVLHIIDLFIAYSPAAEKSSDFGCHVDHTGFLDRVLVEQVIKMLQKAETTIEKMMVAPAPKAQREQLAHIQEELAYFNAMATFFKDATAYLDALEKVDSKTTDLKEGEARDLSERMTASEKALAALISDHSYHKKKVAKGKNALQMLDDMMTEIQDRKRQRRGLKKLGAIAGFAQDKLGIPREGERKKGKGGEESSEFGGITAKIIEDEHAEDLSDRELKEIRVYFTADNMLGQGAYGKVYKAEFRGEDVAVKVLDANDQTSRKVAEAFEKEMRIHMHLRSPRLVNVIRVHRKPPEFLMVTEYMDRGNLRAFLKNEASLSDTKRLELAAQITRGVTFLHQNEPPIAHRDLKPENVLVDHNLNCKLSDFGLAALRADKDAAQKSGSALYMAPEVVLTITGKQKAVPDYLHADMYSLGLLFVELFGGKIPWQGKTFQQIADAHAAHTPRECPTTVTLSVRELINSCLSVDGRDRPTTKQALVAILAILNPDVAKLCDECETAQPTIRCDECQQTLCESCSNSLHKKGKRQAHYLAPFTASVASSAAYSSARVAPSSPRAKPARAPSAPSDEGAPDSAMSVSIDVKRGGGAASQKGRNTGEGSPPSPKRSTATKERSAKAALLSGGED